MASFLENINMPPCIWFEGGDKRNAITSIISGILVKSVTRVIIRTTLFCSGSFRSAGGL